MAMNPGPMLADLEARPFLPTDASAVAAWAETAQELFWLAPGTPPPLTPQKVRDWTADRGHPLMFWRPGSAQAVGYAELNFMPHNSREMWIGHLIVSSFLRGQGLGRSITRHLLRLAFTRFDAKGVSLVVFPENQAAVRCYLKCGMQMDGVQVKSFDHVGGRHRMLKLTMTQRRYRRHSGPIGQPA